MADRELPEWCREMAESREADDLQVWAYRSTYMLDRDAVEHFAARAGARALREVGLKFDELESGVIRNQNIHFAGGRGRLDEDAGSYRTNAVRHLEDPHA